MTTTEGSSPLLLQLLFFFFVHIVSSLLIAVLFLRILKLLFSAVKRRRRRSGTPATTANIPLPPPPGSNGLPLIGETLSFVAANNSSKGFYEFVRTRRLRYGSSCFKTNIFGKTQVFVSSTDAARQVLGSDFVDFTKRYISSIAKLLGEHSLLCASHHHHHHLRRRLAALFTADSLSSSVVLFDQLTLEALAGWSKKHHRDDQQQGGQEAAAAAPVVVVLSHAFKITFRTICKMLMSLEREDELERLQKDVSEVSEAMLAFPLKLPWTRFSTGLKARQRIMDTLKKMIELRRGGVEHHEDFLQSLLIKDENIYEDSLTDSQIIDNILTLIIAGQVTTASAITWMVKYLDENQQVQETLRELHSSLACNASTQPLRLEDLNEMSYASKIVKESLRMATIVSWFPRIALEDCEIEGFWIRKGWIVNVDARYIHSDPTVYEDPTMFCPWRFNVDPKPYSFLAFGTGGRTCLGMNLAKAMMLVFLHRLVTNYRWKVIDNDPSLEKWALFPRLKNGCPISVTPIGSL